jgi:hypothetical protein
MKLVRDHAEVIGKSFCTMTKIEYGRGQLRTLRRYLTSQESKLDRKHRQLLIQAVMQFSSDAPSLLFLGLQEFASQILKNPSGAGTFQCHSRNGAVHGISL